MQISGSFATKRSAVFSTCYWLRLLFVGEQVVCSQLLEISFFFWRKAPSITENSNFNHFEMDIWSNVYIWIIVAAVVEHEVCWAACDREKKKKAMWRRKWFQQQTLVEMALSDPRLDSVMMDIPEVFQPAFSILSLQTASESSFHLLLYLLPHHPCVLRTLEFSELLLSRVALFWTLVSSRDDDQISSSASTHRLAFLPVFFSLPSLSGITSLVSCVTY